MYIYCVFKFSIRWDVRHGRAILPNHTPEPYPEPYPRTIPPQTLYKRSKKRLGVAATTTTTTTTATVRSCAEPYPNHTPTNGPKRDLVLQLLLLLLLLLKLLLLLLPQSGVVSEPYPNHTRIIPDSYPTHTRTIPEPYPMHADRPRVARVRLAQLVVHGPVKLRLKAQFPASAGLNVFRAAIHTPDPYPDPYPRSIPPNHTLKSNIPAGARMFLGKIGYQNNCFFWKQVSFSTKT